MGYAYEDEENESLEIEKEEQKQENEKNSDSSKFIVDNLMTLQEEEGNPVDSSYSVDNLLIGEEEKDVYLNDLLNKKDMRLFNAYLGNNASKITDKNFNFAAFFFGGAYLIYRKVYGIGAFVLALTLIVQILFPIARIKWYITLIFELLVYLAVGIFANQLILNNAAAKILNLKMANEKDIKDKLIKIGGCNIILFIIALVINSSILSFSYYTKTIDLMNSLKEDKVPSYIEYDGRINANESVNIRTLLDIEPPENYKTSHADSYQYSFSYVDDANIAIDIVLTSKYESATSLLNGIISSEGKTKDDVNEYSFNGIKWFCLESDLAFYGVGVIENNVYLIRHMHRGNISAFVDYPSFLESIKIIK